MAAENRIRAGADAALGYLRFGMIDLLKLLVGVFGSRAAREAETGFLRQQLVVLRRSAPARLRLRTADRLIFVWLYRLFPSLLEAAAVFKPETPVRWHRSGFRLYWRWKSRRRVGRVRSPRPHAKVVKIDVALAIRGPGVIAVLTGSGAAGDGLEPIPHSVIEMGEIAQVPVRR